MNISEIITTIKDILVGIAAATTAIVAIIGLKSWKRELKGKADFEVARNFIKATYKLRDELQICRSPFIWAHEFPESYTVNVGKSSPEEEARAYMHVYKNRLAPVWNAIQEFNTYTLEAEALWGKEIRSRANQLTICINELNSAINAVISDKADRGEHFKTDKSFGVKMHCTISAAIDDEQNEFSKKILTAVSEIENQIRPHLQRG